MSTEYLWKHSVCDIDCFDLIYMSDVPANTAGKWAVSGKQMMWELNDVTYTFTTQEDLVNFLNKSYNDYIIQQDRLRFSILFGGVGFLKALKIFLKYYINMEED